jgi:PTS system nitrogen regulatory IIA component
MKGKKMVYMHSLLKTEQIRFLSARSKQEALEELIQIISQSPHILDEKTFKKAVFERESIMSTGIGLGIAIPHVKVKSVTDLTLAVGISKSGIEWGSLDGKPVHIVFLIAGSEDQHEQYLRILSKIILVLKNENRRKNIIEAKDAQTIIDQFQTV